jgi:hypothetical protein
MHVQACLLVSNSYNQRIFDNKQLRNSIDEANQCLDDSNDYNSTSQ